MREKGVSAHLLIQKFVPAGLTDHKVESSRIDFSKTAVAAERYSHGYSRIIAFELHTSGDEQVIQLVNVQRAASLAEQKRAGLCDRAIAKSIADRDRVTADRRNSPVLIQVRDRVIAAIAALIIDISAIVISLIPGIPGPGVEIVLDLHRFAQGHHAAAGAH